MTNQQRNQLLAQELRELANMIESDDWRVEARICIEPSESDMADASDKYLFPRAVRTVSSGRYYFESRALDGCLRVRLKGGAA